MDSGSISAWNLAAGDSFAAGDVFCSVETDKAVVDFEAQDEGVIAKLLVAAGTEVTVGVPVMIVVEDPAHVAAFADYTHVQTQGTKVAAKTNAPPPPIQPTPSTRTTAPTSAPSSTTITKSSGKVFASPLARKLAKDMNYDVSTIPGTGPSGRVVAADVKSFQPATALVAAATTTTTSAAAATASQTDPSRGVIRDVTIGDGFKDYPIASQSAAEVAARLAQSKRNVPHYYLTVDINADELLNLRRKLNTAIAGSSKESSSIGVYELLIKAAALAMKTVPSANAAWMDTAVRVYDSVDINIVTGSGESISTPVLRDCVGKGLRAISTELNKGMDYGGPSADDVDTGVGTLTMVNVGMYGVKSCAPIIREPQACALAIGALQNRIVPASSSSSSQKSDGDGGGSLYQESVMFTVTASFDHRVVDGAVGAQWLAAFKSHAENPSTLLL